MRKAEDKLIKNSIKLSSKVLPQENPDQSEVTQFETSNVKNESVIFSLFMTKIAKRGQ